MSCVGVRPLLRLTQVLFVRKEVAAAHNLGQIFRSANEGNGVQSAMHRAAYHAFPAYRTRECRHGYDGADPGKRPG